MAAALVYEHQRYFPTKGWTDKVLASDPPSYCLSDRTPATKPKRSLGYEPVATSHTDSHGWEYAEAFDVTKWVGAAEKRHLVRRRIWKCTSQVKVDETRSVSKPPPRGIMLPPRRTPGSDNSSDSEDELRHTLKYLEMDYDLSHALERRRSAGVKRVSIGGEHHSLSSHPRDDTPHDRPAPNVTPPLSSDGDVSPSGVSSGSGANGSGGSSVGYGRLSDDTLPGGSPRGEGGRTDRSYDDVDLISSGDDSSENEFEGRPSGDPRCLVVRVGKGCKLGAATGDSYVQLRVGRRGGWAQTSVRKGDTPVWNEELMLPVGKSPGMLEVAVYHRTRRGKRTECRHEFLAQGGLRLNDLTRGVPTKFRVPLLQQSSESNLWVKTAMSVEVIVSAKGFGKMDEEVTTRDPATVVRNDIQAGSATGSLCMLPAREVILEQQMEVTGQAIVQHEHHVEVHRSAHRHRTVEHSTQVQKLHHSAAAAVRHWQGKETKQVQASDNGPPRLEVTVLNAVELGDPSITTFVALRVTDGSWQRTGPQTGNNPKYNCDLVVPLGESNGVLEVRVFQTVAGRDELLGRGLLPLNSLSHHETFTYRVTLGTVQHGTMFTENEHRALMLRIASRNFRQLRTVKYHARGTQEYKIGYTGTHTTRILKKETHSSSSSIRRQSIKQREFIHGFWGNYLDITVKEACDLNPLDCLNLSDLYIALQFGDVKFRTDVVDASVSPTWNEQFRLELPPFGPTAMEISFYGRHGSRDRPVGRGKVDLATLPWRRNHKIECQVRLMLQRKLAGVITILLTPVPLCAIRAWLEFISQITIIQTTYWEEAYQMWEMEELHRHRLYAELEAGGRSMWIMQEQRMWMHIIQTSSAWMERWRRMSGLMCSLRVKVMRGVKTGWDGECAVGLAAGGHQCRTTARRPQGGNIMWNEESLFHLIGTKVEDCKIVTHGLQIGLWENDQLKGVARVQLKELCQQVVYDLTVTVSGVAIFITLEALDFGLPVVEEEPRLEVLIQHADDLPMSDADGDGECDPYVACRVLTTQGKAVEGQTDKWVTTTSKKGLKPVWNEQFTLAVPKDDPQSGMLEVAVFDKDKKGGHDDDLMGTITLRLTGMVRGVPSPYRLGVVIRNAAGEEVSSTFVYIKVCARGFGVDPQKQRMDILAATVQSTSSHSLSSTGSHGSVCQSVTSGTLSAGWSEANHVSARTVLDEGTPAISITANEVRDLKVSTGQCFLRVDLENTYRQQSKVAVIHNGVAEWMEVFNVDIWSPATTGTGLQLEVVNTSGDVLGKGTVDLSIIRWSRGNVVTEVPLENTKGVHCGVVKLTLNTTTSLAGIEWWCQSSRLRVGCTQEEAQLRSSIFVEEGEARITEFAQGWEMMPYMLTTSEEELCRARISSEFHKTGVVGITVLRSTQVSDGIDASPYYVQYSTGERLYQTKQRTAVKGETQWNETLAVPLRCSTEVAGGVARKTPVCAAVYFELWQAAGAGDARDRLVGQGSVALNGLYRGVTKYYTLPIPKSRTQVHVQLEAVDFGLPREQLREILYWQDQEVFARVEVEEERQADWDRLEAHWFTSLDDVRSRETGTLHVTCLGVTRQALVNQDKHVMLNLRVGSQVQTSMIPIGAEGQNTRPAAEFMFSVQCAFSGDVRQAIQMLYLKADDCSDGLVMRGESTTDDSVALNHLRQGLPWDTTVALDHLSGAVVKLRLVALDFGTEATSEERTVGRQQWQLQGEVSAMEEQEYVERMCIVHDEHARRQEWEDMDHEDVLPPPSSPPMRGAERLRATLGVSIKGIDDKVMIVGVTSQGPADEAGLQKGDILAEWDGVELHRRQDFANCMKDALPGTTALVTVLRGERCMEKQVVIGALSAKPPKRVELSPPCWT